VFGFIFNFSDGVSGVKVTPFETVVNESEWFADAIKNATDLRFIVLLGHIPPTQPELQHLRASLQHRLRTLKQRDYPVVVLGGHDHILVNETDAEGTNTTILIESLCFFHAIHIINFALPVVQPNGTDAEPFIDIVNTTLWTNVSQMQQHAGVAPKNWDTTNSTAMRTAIKNKVKELKLSEPWAYSPRFYSSDPLIIGDSSLYSLLLNQATPHADPFPPENQTDRPQTMYIANSGTLRANLFQGNVLYDDLISLYPFQDTYTAYRNVSVSDLLKVMASNISRVLHPQELISGVMESPFVGKDGSFYDNYRYTNISLAELHVVDVVMPSFDASFIKPAFDLLCPGQYELTSSNKSSRMVLFNYITSHFPVPPPPHKQRPLYIIAICYAVVGVLFLATVLLIIIIAVIRHRRATVAPAEGQEPLLLMSMAASKGSKLGLAYNTPPSLN
jgi:hypothetical protein